MVGPLAKSQMKEWATVGPYGPDTLGYTRPTMVETMRCNPERGSKSPKLNLSSDRGLQPAHVKPESLVSKRHNRLLNTSLFFAHTACQAMRVHSW